MLCYALDDDILKTENPQSCVKATWLWLFVPQRRDGNPQRCPPASVAVEDGAAEQGARIGARPAILRLERLGDLHDLLGVLRLAQPEVLVLVAWTAAVLGLRLTCSCLFVHALLLPRPGVLIAGTPDQNTTRPQS